MHNAEADTLLSAPAPSGAGATLLDAWSPEVLTRIERELARSVGPVAGTLVRRAARRHTTPEALVQALAPSIESASDRAAFVRACAIPAAPQRQAAPVAAPLLPPAAPAALRSTTKPTPTLKLAPKPAPAPPAPRSAPAARAVPSFDTLTQPLRERFASDRRQRGATARALSPHWRGIATRGHRDLALLPLWSAVALAGALLLASWFTLNARLDARARPLFAGIAAVPAALQATAAAPAARPRLAATLAFDTPAGPIEVRDEAQRSLVVVPADALFADGSARLDARAGELLARVAQALRTHVTQAQAQGQGAGELSVIGHGDPASPSLKFPSNWHFTRARAQAVADALAAHGVAAARAEGRAEFEPRVPGSGAAERARNRRIEIELRLPRPEQAQP